MEMDAGAPLYTTIFSTEVSAMAARTLGDLDGDCESKEWLGKRGKLGKR